MRQQPCRRSPARRRAEDIAPVELVVQPRRKLLAAHRLQAVNQDQSVDGLAGLVGQPLRRPVRADAPRRPAADQVRPAGLAPAQFGYLGVDQVVEVAAGHSVRALDEGAVEPVDDHVVGDVWELGVRDCEAGSLGNIQSVLVAVDGLP